MQRIILKRTREAAKAKQRLQQMEGLKLWSLSSKPFTFRHLLHFASSTASVTTTTKLSYSTHVLRCCSTTTTRVAGRNRRQSSTSSSTSDRDAIRALRLKKVSTFLFLYVPILCFLVVLVLWSILVTGVVVFFSFSNFMLSSIKKIIVMPTFPHELIIYRTMLDISLLVFVW